jgi:hypothetical protein
MKFGSILLLACLQVSAQSNYLVFQSGNFQGLKDSSNQEILPAVYDGLGWTGEGKGPTDGIIGYQENDKWGLLSVEGKKITPPLYDKLEPLGEANFKVAVKGKFTNRFFYGIVDAKGKLLLNLDYFDIQLESPFVFLTTYEGGVFRMGALSDRLKVIAKTEYEKIGRKNRMAIAKTPSGHYDIFNESGKVLEDHLDQLEIKDDYLITRKGGKDGLISLKGEVIHPPIHKAIYSDKQIVPFPTWEVRTGTSTFDVVCDSISYLSKDVWLKYYNNQLQIYSLSKEVAENTYKLIQLSKDMVIVRSIAGGDFHAISANGNVVLAATDSLIYTGQYMLGKNGKEWSVYSRLGAKITDRSFDQVLPFEGQYVGVKKFGYWAILDGLSKSVSDFRYDTISSIKDYKAIVKYVNKWGVLHTNSGWIIQPEYDKISFELDHFVAVKGYSYYLHNAYGELVFKTIDHIVPAKDHFLLKYEHLHSAIGTHGLPVANTSYLSVNKMGNYFALDEGTYTAVVSSTGKFIIGQKDQIDKVDGFGDGLFVIKKNGAFGFVDENAKLRIANRYDSAKVFSEGLAPVKIRGNWGFINKAEQLAIQPYYQSVTPFYEGLSLFKLRGKYGLMNTLGKEIVTADYQKIVRSSNGVYLVQDVKNKWGLVDGQGVSRLSPAFDRLTDLGENKLLAIQNGKAGLVDYSGRILVPFQYEEIVKKSDYTLLRKPIN